MTVDVISESQMSVNVGRGESLRQHEHLHVVDQLRNLRSRLVVGLVFGRHPDLGGLLDDFLTNGVHASIQLTYGPGILWPSQCLFAELGEEFVECLHLYRLLVRMKVLVRGGTQPADLFGWVQGTKHAGSGNKSICSCLSGHHNRFFVNATVYL